MRDVYRKKGKRTMAERYDAKRRKLQTGEYYNEKTGRYKYRYKDNDGEFRDIYSWTLTRNDRIPAGKNQKSGESLREKEAEIQKVLAEGINSGKGNMTLYALMELYISIKLKDVKETTKKGYRTQLNFMRDCNFGKKKIKDITETDAIKWFDELHEKEGKNYSTLQTLRGILRPAYKMAKKNRWVRDNPFDFSLNKKRYGGSKTREALSRKDMRRFLDFVRTDKHFCKYFEGIYILFNTGLRISEFCGLTMDDIDFKRHVIHVNKQLLRTHENGKAKYYVEDSTKTPTGERDVPMSDDVEQCFRTVIANRPKLDTEPVVSTLDGKGGTWSGFLWFDKNNNLEVEQHWDNHFRWAVSKFNRIYKDELENVTPHIARHTFCSNMAGAGMSPKTLQTIMGHSGIEVTLNVYTHLENSNIMSDFYNIINNEQYAMYPLERKPDIYSPGDDTEEDEPEMLEYDSENGE